jgi:hypothetical protein
MPITASLLKITLRYAWLGQQMQTARYFEPVGAAFLTATPAAVGEAFWNDVKTAWRGVAPAAQGNIFQSVVVEEIGGGLEFGEFPVPVAEQQGTRSSTGLGEPLPSFLAVGMRFTVSSRVTRPGQMRIPWLWEADVNGNQVQAALLTLCNALGTKLSSTITLGAPVATGTLRQTIVRFTATVPPVVEAQQMVNGYVTNGFVTSQISRKVGRGN